jgi:hypothetical protein
MRTHPPTCRWIGSRVRCFRPRVERMEARALLATFTVNSTIDAVDADPGGGTALTATGQITLRSAIQEANALAGGDTIVLPAGTYTLTIPGTGENGAAKGDLDITGDLTISGGDPGTTIVDGGNIDRIFEIMPNVIVSISGVTIQDGETPNASLSPGISSDGGAIDNKGNLTLTNCVVQNSVAGALIINGQPSQNAFGVSPSWMVTPEIETMTSGMISKIRSILPPSTMVVPGAPPEMMRSPVISRSPVAAPFSPVPGIVSV